MARPKKLRRLGAGIKPFSFRPRGIPLLDLQTSELKGDELEAMRLCYLNNCMHETAARKMKVSRRTLERILNSGRRKVTEALLTGKGINISFPNYILFKGR